MLTSKNLIPKITTLGLALSLTLASVFAADQVSAQNDKSTPNRGLPTRRVGGGSRDGCPNSPCIPIIALMPEQLVVTSSPNPTLVFYIPKLQADVKVEFVLRDQQDQQICEATFNTQGQEGIVSISLAYFASCQGLKAEQNYRWYLSIINNPLDRAHDNVAEGWVSYTQLNPSVVAEIEKATPLEKVELYQKNELWHEAFATIVQLKQVNPHNPAVAEKWQDLLQAVKLEQNLQAVLNNAASQPPHLFSDNSRHWFSRHF